MLSQFQKNSVNYLISARFIVAQQKVAVLKYRNFQSKESIINNLSQALVTDSLWEPMHSTDSLR